MRAQELYRPLRDAKEFGFARERPPRAKFRGVVREPETPRAPDTQPQRATRVSGFARSDNHLYESVTMR